MDKVLRWTTPEQAVRDEVAYWRSRSVDEDGVIHVRYPFTLRPSAHDAEESRVRE